MQITLSVTTTALSNENLCSNNFPSAIGNLFLMNDPLLWMNLSKIAPHQRVSPLISTSF